MILQNITIVIVMVGVGAHINIDDVKRTMRGRSLRAILWGLALQLLGMPPLAVLICKAVQPSSSTSLALLLISSCPGGPASSVFATLTASNVLVNGSMTLVSTVLAVVTLPLSMLIYKPMLTANDAHVDFMMLAATVMMLTTALAIGAAGSHWRPSSAIYIKQLTGVPAFVTLCILASLGGIPLVPPCALVAAFALAITGAAGGLAVGLLTRADWRCIKSLSLELLIRDTGVGLSIATTAFTGHARVVGRLTVLTYAIMAFALSAVLAVVFWVCERPAKTPSNTILKGPDHIRTKSRQVVDRKYTKKHQKSRKMAVKWP